MSSFPEAPSSHPGLGSARVMRSSLYLSYKKNKEKNKGYHCGLAILVNCCKLPAFVTVFSGMTPPDLLAFCCFVMLGLPNESASAHPLIAPLLYSINTEQGLLL